ncbi:hypothetical protein LTR62_002218 [Meristemomyces frigidus]|uniref:Autophagy-related protein 29 n=1 Tax=Meristemomyces frigidus TaxID=1508187 RepID=A0AAN7YHR8_9PEZI|nr:hypothetical protein LTR62_002218 [Meristemomyces frigidus]
MSAPSSTQASVASSRASKPTRSRHTSVTTAPIQEFGAPKAPSPRPSPVIAKGKVHYTCFIRLPFPRGDFQDPPAIEWDASKDRALWKVISKSTNTKIQELNWDEVAARFQVDLPFLLQQAAWLYEQHLEGMRKQMQKLGQSHAVAPVLSGDGSTISTTPGAVPTQRQPSGESSAPRVPSVISTLKAQGIVGATGSGSLGSDGSTPGTPRSAKPPISRSPSTITVTQSKLMSGSSKQPVSLFQRGQRTSGDSQKQGHNLVSTHDNIHASQDEEVLDSDSEEELSRTASQAFRRAPLGKKPLALKRVSSDDEAEHDENDDEDDDGSEGFLPFAATIKAATRGQTTLPPKTAAQGRAPGTTRPSTATKQSHSNPGPESDTTSSTSSAAQAAPSTSSDSATLPTTRPNPLSPRQRAALASAASPKSRRTDGSEGSPSMGSSFSDLDDASVTQSALEEALLSGVQKGNLSLVGRMGGVMRRG